MPKNKESSEKSNLIKYKINLFLYYKLNKYFFTENNNNNNNIEYKNNNQMNLV